MDNDAAWERDAIQFPRLIAELEAVGAFTDEVLSALAAEMDLEIEDIGELVERAQAAWEQEKNGYYYPHIQLWCDLTQSLPYYTELEVRRARADNAPPSAVWRRADGVWFTIEDVTVRSTLGQLYTIAKRRGWTDAQQVITDRLHTLNQEDA